VKLSHIRDILAVAETGSLRSAGRKLGITQPSMTRSIRDIENEFGLVLFSRHSHGVTPTDAGRLFIRRATAIQTEVRRIHEEFAQSVGTFTGQVCVATNFSTGLALMPTVLPSFQKRYPHGQLRITESPYLSIESEIISGEIDFFVGPVHNLPSNNLLSVENLFENQRVIIARKGHPLLSATTLEELRHAQWVRNSVFETPTDQKMASEMTRAGLSESELVMQTRSGLLSLMAVINSDLLMVTVIQCMDFAGIGNLIDVVRLEKKLPAEPICIVRRGDLPLTPLAEAFCDMIRKAGHNYARRLGLTVATLP
jgi:LysR family transcriptional regulator, regulator of abg operon